ncbi:MAG: cytochrome c biogenesis protein CcsA, partial [Myxococcota bacterium]
PAPKMLRGARFGLVLGAAVQTGAFATMHRVVPTPSLTDLGYALALMAWLTVWVTLFLAVRIRLPGFVPPVAFVAFVATFGVTLRRPEAAVSDVGATLPHAHVLLASAGLAALGLAGLAGFFFLLEHRALKQRRNIARRLPVPSLEALDRVNRVTLAVGFPLLTLGVVTGALWLHARAGDYFSGSLHEIWMMVAWLIYFGLAMRRFVGGQGARQAAGSALAGFAFLFFALLGAGVIS